MTETRMKIVGSGMYVPPRVVSNDDLAKLFETSDEWITKRTGIKTRHHIDPGMTPTELATKAALKALEAANMTIDDIDCIVHSTLSPQHYFPGTGFFVQAELQSSKNIPVFDVRAQCTGYLYGMQIADGFIRSKIYKRILVIGSEVHSTNLDYTNEGRDTAVIFGDGAGALVVEATENLEEGHVMSIHLHAQGKHAKRLWVKSPDMSVRPCISKEDLDNRLNFPVMEGKYVFKHAVTRMPEAVMEAMAANNMTGDDVDMFFFHQANLRINEFVQNMMGVPAEKCPNNIQRLGNCSSASIPMLMDECIRDGRLKRGDTALMVGFGSGFSWGSVALKY